GSATGSGGSLAARVLMAPFIFFRPFPWEVHNFGALLAAAEGLFIAIFAWRRRSIVGRALWDPATRVFAAFATLFALEFAVTFAAAVSNLGLLSRQRIIALPLLLMVLCAQNIAVAKAPQDFVSPPEPAFAAA